MGVMEGESAVQAVYGPELEKAGKGSPPSKLTEAVGKMREDYEQWLDARFAGARGFVDGILAPEELRAQLAFALKVVSAEPGPHLGPFVLPATLA
jgi:acetyl-CoA carboxylase carboxyltransferase component